MRLSCASWKTSGLTCDGRRLRASRFTTGQPNVSLAGRGSPALRTPCPTAAAGDCEGRSLPF